MPGEMAGQVALVTGGGRGIGRATALRLARAGAAVAVTARSAAEIEATAAEIVAGGGKALALPADVTDAASMERLVAETRSRLGEIDLLVNNAGTAGPVGPLWEVDLDDWLRCFDITLRGTVIATRLVLPGMVERGRGRIINVSSIAALRGRPYTGAYTTSRAALIRFTEVLAAETNGHGVSVFVIHPGLIPTALGDDFTVTELGKKYMPGFGERLKQSPYTVEGAAERCLLLASGAADALSGRYIDINDDVAEMVRRVEEIEAGNLYALSLGTLPKG